MSLLGPHHTFTFSKKANTVFSGTAAVSQSTTHQPPSGGSYLKVEISGGTSNNGTVTITGSLLGVSKSETLTFSAARWYITANQYDAIATNGITTSGLADEATKPTILIEACDTGGTAKTWTTNYIYYGIFNIPKSVSQSIMMNSIASGNVAPVIATCSVDQDADIGLGDLFTITGQNGTWQVYSEPTRKFELGTDLVSSIAFYATLKSK
jgi:hypothetical protein